MILSRYFLIIKIDNVRVHLTDASARIIKLMFTAVNEFVLKLN